MVKLFLITFLLFACYALHAQDTSIIKEADSIVSKYLLMLRDKKYIVIEGNLLLEGNKKQLIQFLKKDEGVCLIITEEGERIYQYYFLKNQSLFFTAIVKDGDTNNLIHPIYYTTNVAYLKNGTAFRKVNNEISILKVKIYLDLFKEKLNFPTH